MSKIEQELIPTPLVGMAIPCDNTKSPLFLSKDSATTAMSTITLTEPVKINKNRCCASECKRKLFLSDTECRCGQRYCGHHRLPETHSCSFDFKAAGKDLLSKQLVRVNGDESRLERI